MNKKLLQDNKGPFSNLLLNECKKSESEKSTILRFNKSKKNNSKNKGMTSKSPNIKLVDGSAGNKIKVKNDASMNNINLIRDSDSDSIATAEPENDTDSESPINSPIKKPQPSKKSFTKLPTMEADEFRYFTNNKKQKPVIQKEESEDDFSDEEEESDFDESESEISDSGSEPSVKHKKMSSREVEKRKQELLIKLLALEKKGVTLTKNYSLKSSLEEIEFEYNTQQKAAEIEASVHFQQKILMAAVTGVEFLNKKFDPIGAKLDGWSESVMDNITDYEEIFKKLHEKYSERASMPPELQLLVTLVGSGFMFHLTNTLFKSSLPGLGDVLKTNPDIMNNIMGAMGKAMNNSQGLTPNAPQSSVPQQTSAPSVPSVPSVPTFPATQSVSQMNNQMNFPVKPNTMPEFTGPSVNLSSLMNTYESGPNKPMMQQAPKMKQDDIDRFSVASSSDYSEIEPTTRTINTTSKVKGKGKATGKTIKI
jgi:hypothetical protein